MLNAIQNASVASKVLSLQHTGRPPQRGRFAGQQLRLPTLLYLATLGGAQVCNIATHTGSLEPGKTFDALVVSMNSSTENGAVWGADLDRKLGISHSKAETEEEREKDELEVMLERFFFCGDDRNIRRVYVQGRLIGGKDFEA
jgi:guanine deaminase